MIYRSKSRNSHTDIKSRLIDIVILVAIFRGNYLVYILAFIRQFDIFWLRYVKEGEVKEGESICGNFFSEKKKKLLKKKGGGKGTKGGRVLVQVQTYLRIPMAPGDKSMGKGLSRGYLSHRLTKARRMRPCATC